MRYWSEGPHSPSRVAFHQIFVRPVLFFQDVSMLCIAIRRRDEAPIAHSTFIKEIQ
jgi:hypothetical protein